MAEAINAGIDLHRLVASRLTGKPESEITKDERQKAKAVNFGLPGGIVDLILEGEYGPIVVDFKTAASASYCNLQHELQLTAYANLVRAFYGYDESALEVRQLVKTKVPKIVTHKFSPRSDEHIDRFFNIVREYLDALDRGVFNYRPSWNCGMCEHSLFLRTFFIFSSHYVRVTPVCNGFDSTFLSSIMPYSCTVGCLWCIKNRQLSGRIKIENPAPQTLLFPCRKQFTHKNNYAA